LVSEIKKGGGRALFISLEVTEQDQWDAAVTKVKDEFGDLHILMNIVGSNDLVMLPEVDFEAWNKMFESNVTATARGMQTCAPLMRDSGGGSIVNIGSVAGITGNFSTGYSSSKWAVEGLSRSAAYVYADWGIRCNVIQPGFIETDDDRQDHLQPCHAQDVRAHDEPHHLVAPDGQGRRDRLHGSVPGQRRVVLYHRKPTSWLTAAGSRRLPTSATSEATTCWVSSTPRRQPTRRRRR
jgi:NAD(P)-dependent dehydrogenase (short-subunit alcohol dehydrogenase family)